jgi:enamine deaminase RidA (YjgF/YER057c/UK114 family)
MAMRPVSPQGLAQAKGYSHGMKGTGEVLFVAGQVGWDRDARLVSEAFAAQFGQALDNVLTVVRAAGGRRESVGRLTIYVTDKREYLAAAKDVGVLYREHMGDHYPAMALVQVSALLEDGAKVEIEATAVL